MMDRRILLTASTFGVTAVILGAFGAHSLKDLVSSGALEIWSKGVEYQFYHTFALLFLSLFTLNQPKMIKIAYICFSLGIVLFSGSLYLLATREVLQLGFVKYIGPVTPIGGLFFIIGWFTLFFAALKNK